MTTTIYKLLTGILALVVVVSSKCSFTRSLYLWQKTIYNRK